MRSTGFIVLFLLLAGSFTSVCQSNSSGIYTMRPEPGDTLSRTEIQSKIKNARQQFERDSLIDVQLLEEILSASIKGNYLTESADAYLLLAEMNRATGQCENAVKNSRKSYDLYITLNQSRGQIKAIQVLTDCYIQLENYTLAEQYYNSGIRACHEDQLNDKLLLKLGLGRLYLKTGSAQARELFIEIEKTALENNLLSIASEAQIELGNLEQKKGNLVKAQEYFSQAKENAKQAQNPILVYNSNVYLSNSFNSANDGMNATYVWNDAANYFTAERDTGLLINSTIACADQNVANGNYATAINQLNYTYSLSGASSDITSQLTAAEKLYSLYSITGGTNGIKATEAYKKYLTLKDSVDKLKSVRKDLFVNNQKALNNVQDEVGVLEKQRELDQQTIELLQREQNLNQAEIQNQRVLLYVFGFLILLSIGVGFYVYRNNKAKKRATQMLYLKSLRSQMNPHFIFNSLNSVNSFITQNNEREANKYLSRFAKLMRQILDQSESEFIPLTKEIEVLQLYVQLEHDRFKDAFDFVFEVDPSIEPENYQIPPMLVQPFVENAVWHGLRYKESGGLLTIRFINHGGFIEINVRDNGIGREASKRLKTKNQKQHNSAGMTILENRMRVINQLFNTRIRFELIDLPQESGTEVKIFVYPSLVK